MVMSPVDLLSQIKKIPTPLMITTGFDPILIQVLWIPRYENPGYIDEY